MNKLALSALVAVCVGISVPAAAQFAKTEDAIKYRQSALSVMGEHFSRIGQMATGRVPYDAATAAANAEIVATMAKLPWAAFGTGQEGGKAKPEIWKDPAQFKENQDKMIAETGKLLVAAKAGNLDALKAQFGATEESCKTCHKAFRNR